MKKYLISASVGALAAVASAMSASAATVTTVDCTAQAEPCNLGVVSGANTSFTIIFNDVDANNDLSEGFQFQIAANTTASALTITEAQPDTVLASLTLTGPGAAFSTPCITLGDVSSCGITVPTGLALGTFIATLSLNGINPFIGQATFTLGAGLPGVPLPGALLLMGSVLMGGAGLAKWRKSSSRLAA